MLRQKNINTSIRLRALTYVAMLLLPAFWPLASSADLLNRIEVYKASDVGVIHILLTRPVFYTYHFPPEHSYLIHIYFNDLALDRGSAMQHGAGTMGPHDEFMRGPANDIVPVFWVAYNNHGTGDLNLDPFHLMVQFGEPVHYKIAPDADNRGFLIFVLKTDAAATKEPSGNKDRTESRAEPAPAKTDSKTTDHP